MVRRTDRGWMLGFVLVVGTAACTTNDNEDAQATNEAVSSPAGARCGWIPQGAFSELVRCPMGYGCQGQVEDDLGGDVGHCALLPLSKESEDCDGVSNRICDDGLMCVPQSTRPPPGMPGTCKPRPASGTMSRGCLTSNLSMDCPSGFLCRPGAPAGAASVWTNGTCTAP